MKKGCFLVLSLWFSIVFFSGVVVIASSSVMVVLHPCWVGSLEEDRGD